MTDEFDRRVEEFLRRGRGSDEDRAAFLESIWTSPAALDESVLRICAIAGHSFEGRLVVGPRCLGRCDRCGVGAMTDGS